MTDSSMRPSCCNAVVMMARVPRPGQTKTRMLTHLTGQQCADLHTCFIRDELRACLQAEAKTFVAYTPGEDRCLLDQALAPLGEDVLGLFPQVGEGLGARLLHAVSWAFAQGFSKCLVLGSDVPEITPELIDRAFAELDRHQVVVGPARDGGFYLMALGCVMPEAFSLETYGHDQVFRQTMKALEARGHDVFVLPSLHDMDTFADAQGLLERNRGRHVAAESVAYLDGLAAAGELGEL